ncbi:MAG: phosphohydrolase [Caldilinea sp.]|uniref:phosphohydrolase n=1 Tax=Caldilinea sp. TaxID=2293560 RepID=UPI002BFF1D88|nr:HD domain-containing protein [Anaerolineales bacterium]HQY92786.1 HD domain-containing protein [Caldilinea sp.]
MTNKKLFDALNTNHDTPEVELTSNGRRLITVEDMKRDPEVVAMLQAANAIMKALGYTEHGQRHAGLVGNIAQNVLEHLGYDERTYQLSNVAGYLHDIGNVIHRQNHALSGSLLAWGIMKRMNMSPQECATVMNAIGNHEEERGTATSAISAAVIIGDKADVHRSRVQNPRMEDFDIHDRVNYAAKRSFVRVRPEEKIIALELEIDTYYAAVIEYFEIFLSRMTMMRQACEFLGCKYQLVVNDTQFA